jgi:hypothetical protein
VATHLGGLFSRAGWARPAVRCAIACLLAITVGWWAGTPVAGAQDRAAAATPATATAADSDAPVAIDQGDIVDPKSSLTPPLAPADGDTGEPGPADADPGPTPGDGDSTHRLPAGAVTPKALARGNAAMQPPRAKEQEAKVSCDLTTQPTSQLLAIGGSVESDPPRSWTALALVIFLGAAVVAAAAFALRKRASRGGAGSGSKGMLEVVATVVAISAGVAGLAAQFVPGIGVHDAPPPEASMQVRDVNARITRGDFAHAVNVDQPPSTVDRREIGNVVWLAIHLKGYRGKKLTLQWGSYDVDHGGAFVPGTDKTASISVTGDSDAQTLFQPIWVGYPKKAQFQVEFRLLDRGQVREIASTDEMRGALYRYSCPSQS